MPHGDRIAMSAFPPPPPPPGLGTRGPRLATTIQRQPPAKSAYPVQLGVQGWEFSWEYWFNYFYDELSSEGEKRKYWEAICPSDGVYRREADIPETEKKRLLREMMNLGFRPFLTSERLTAAEMFESLESNRGLMGRKDPGYPLQHSGVRVVFRGDARPSDKIKEKDGTLPQTRVADLTVSRSFDKPWHPWNDVSLAGKVYFRKGPNQDNCLFTAISVTPNFEVATKFPC